MRQVYVLMTSDEHDHGKVGEAVAVYGTASRAQQMLRDNRAENPEAHFWVKQTPIVSESDFYE